MTRVLDRRTGTVRDFVRVPLYPLAEWLATSWWLLAHERETPAKRACPDFRRRHALGASREGYTLPDLEVVSAGTRTRIAWTKASTSGTDIELLSDGMLSVATGGLFESFADFIDRVVKRLVSLGIEGTMLQEDWSAVRSADEDEVVLCRTAAGLGWDPYALDDTRRDQAFRLPERLGGLIDEAVPILDPEVLEAGCSVIVAAVKDARCHAPPLSRLARLCAELGPEGEAGETPRNAGDALARHLRRSLRLEASPLPTMKRLADALGEKPTSLEKATAPEGPLTGVPLLDGVIARRDDGCPAVALRPRPEPLLRFHLCRALGEVLASANDDALLTRASTDRQERNRAFAAELLAPSSWIKRRAPGQTVDAATVDTLAAEFGVSSRLVRDQIVDHRIATVGPAE